MRCLDSGKEPELRERSFWSRDGLPGKARLVLRIVRDEWDGYGEVKDVCLFVWAFCNCASCFFDIEKSKIGYYN